MASTTCPVQGNPDLYGLGIRLAIYTQMFTVQLSSLSSLTLRTTDALTPPTILLILATIAVLIRQLAHRAIQPVEVFPILTLLLAQSRVCRVPFARRNRTTATIYLAELVALVVLFVWFWWHGMDVLPRSCADDKAFFFAKVSIWHWFRTFNKVSSVLFAIAGALAVGVYAMGLLWYAVVGAVELARRIQHLRYNHELRPEDMDMDMDGGDMGLVLRPAVAAAPAIDSKTSARNGRGRESWQDSRDEGAAAAAAAAVFSDQEHSTSALGGGSDFLVNVGAIVFVEMSLKWNHISGVHSLSSAGQFMPFFVSLAQLLSVLYDAAKKGLSLAAAEDDDDDGQEEEDPGDGLENPPCRHGLRLLRIGHAESLPLTRVPSE